ncbi:MAG TPA: hypothetical protein VH703_02325, partial [Solirubrobacterales bacterium]
RWNRARKSEATLRRVQRTAEEAQRLGFTGTPSFAVEGPGTAGKKTLGTPGDAAILEAAVEEAG